MDKTLDQMGTAWSSDIPNDKVVIILRTAKVKNQWGEWVTAASGYELRAFVRSSESGKFVLPGETRHANQQLAVFNTL
jgi:hypothetical protein